MKERRHMTVIDIDEKQGAWFDMEGGGRVLLKPLSAAGFRAIRKQATTKSVEYKRIDGKAERFEVEEVNEDLQNELFWDAVILGWENLVDAKKKPIPFTKENKLILVAVPKFLKFVNEALQKMGEDELAKVEDAEKNLLPG